jgi:hypothetical protein
MAVKLNSPYMLMGNVGGSRPGDNPPMIYGEGADPASQLADPSNTMPWYAKVAAGRAAGLLPEKGLTKPGGGMMDDWLDAMTLATGGKAKLAGGPSAEGSNQLRGVSAQPGYLATSQPVVSGGGSTMPTAVAARRPSMQALSGAGQPPSNLEINDYLAGIPMTNEQTREAGIIAGADARAGAGLAADAAQSAADFDLFGGRAGIRSRAAGDIANASAAQQQAGANARYFDRDEQTKREAERRWEQHMAEINKVLPAQIRGQYDVEGRTVTGTLGQGREAIANEGRRDVANTTGNSRIGAAFATQNDVANASKYAPGVADGKPFPAAMLPQFMQENGIQDEATARRLLIQYGYAVQ